MRLQGISIIFALVVLPIILVIAYYISLQIDTITLQNKYTSNLLDATYDALSSFEINTANEDLSTVSDSLRTIIEASDNIFMNALATNLGMSNASKSRLEPYIPAVLHTLYDGYYIYAPTYAPTVITDSDGNAVSVGDPGVTYNGTSYDYTESSDNEILWDHLTNKTDYGQLLYYTKTTSKGYDTDGKLEYKTCTTSLEPASTNTTDPEPTKAKYTTKNILKSYIPYSARYVQDIKDSENHDCKADVNVIYTLDNYVTIEGTFTYGSDDSDARKIYWTKSGYLVPFTKKNADGESFLSVKVSFDGSNFTNPLKYNQNEIQEYIEAGNPITIQVLKDLNDVSKGYETIIVIDDSNKALIDKTNTNTESDTAKLNRYENVLFSLEELVAKIRAGVDIDLKLTNIDSEGNPIRTDLGNIIYNALDYLGNTDDFDNFQFDNKNDLLAKINTSDIINRIKKELINPTKYRIQLNSAAVYYAKAAIFSTWVKDNLSDLKINSIKDISGINYTTYTEEMVNKATNDYNYLNLWKSEDKVFDFVNGNQICGSTEIRQDSSYYTQKIEIIRTSIQYNLNLSMSSYNRHVYYDDKQTYAYNKNVDYTMPVMSQSEWEQILSNISIVSFMQGFDCYLKKYNNYVVVTSSNNEIMTAAEDVYYAKVNEFNDESSEYHKYNCNKVKKAIVESDKYMAFSSKEVKYDKIPTRSTILPYKYDHKNLACYECINDGNYKGTNIFEISSDPDEETKNAYLRKAFYIGVAKERNDVYKMNAVKNSQGYEVLGAYNSSVVQKIWEDKPSLLGMDKIKEIEITFGAVDVERRDEGAITFAVGYPNSSTNLRNIPHTSDSMTYSIPTDTTNKYTWKIQVEPTITNTDPFSLPKLFFINQNPLSSLVGDIKDAIVAIRIIYK